MSKWLKPLGEGEVRSNRPRINVEEIEDKLVYSLIVNTTFEKSDLEESFHHMSLDNDGNDSLNLSVTSANFDPEYKSSPAPRKPPFFCVAEGALAAATDEDSADEMITFYMMDHQTFYGLVQQYAVPFLQAGGPQGGTMKPHRMTPDSLLALLLLKIHENLSDRVLGVLFGESASAVNKWLHGLRNHIYQHDPWLERLRNLSNNQ